MLKRKIIKEFEIWAKENLKKALLLKGVRQVGKTTSYSTLCIRLDITTYVGG